MWPNERLLDLLQLEVPIIQAPMAGANGSAMAIAVSEAGGLGSLPCAMLNEDKMRAEAGNIRQQTTKPFSMNFFCHTVTPPSAAQQAAWTERLAPFYAEYGLNTDDVAAAPVRRAFDEGMCELIEDIKPNAVSFHFGLPDAALLKRVKAAGACVLSSATTVKEARWLEENGCDAIIAQGYEAGGHRGMFLTQDITAQAGSMALLPQVVDAVNVPVIAAGGIADGRGIAAAFALGAAGVQIGTAYLFTPQSLISDIHRTALHQAKDDQTVLTNVFSGKPARGLINRIIREVGPMSEDAPPFPTAGAALAPLKAKAEQTGSVDFTSLWSGQAAALGRNLDAGELTRTLASDAQRRLKALAGK
ncbi:nitronate monooxygenase [Sneathiella sp. CAU 1612]|uniref:Propionate 3-nitronate monooxygenase n=1 Tax=Sneathiella sedimenti TaxID=2816034 RepID=A0ABS3F2P9_9PROT|nr:nitronate monooxygenase [Sneathiella sedimenti]MBO0332795.1 nitronate monooxygenase [Sneathiella sedimenti]